MKKLALSFLILVNSAWSYDSFESEKHLYAFHAFTKEVNRFFIQFPNTETESAILKELKYDLYKCGISSTVETCLDSDLKSFKSLKTFKKEDEEGVRYLLKGITKKLYDYFNIIQIMAIHYEAGDIIVDSVEYFKLNEAFTENDFSTIFDLYSAGALTPVMSFDEFLTKDPNDYLLEAEISITPEKILHFLKYALKLNDSEELKEKVTNILKEKLDLIKDLKNSFYQEEYLAFLEELNILNDDIALAYLNSSDEEVKMRAAIVLSMRGKKEPASIQDLVVKGLKFHDYKDQLRALDGIYKIRENLTDDILLMDMMLDGNAEVSEKAYHLSLALELNDDHLGHIKSLLETKYPSFRTSLLNLVNKIDTKAGRAILIDFLVDNSEEVIKVAFRHLKTKELSKDEKNSLYEFLKNIRPHTKFYVLQLINMDKSDKATEAIIWLLKDLNPKVKELASVLLDKRENLPKFKELLKEMVGKKRSRILAIKLLNRFEEAAITNLFISNLRNLKDDDQSELFRIIKARKFTGEEFKTLTKSYRTLKDKVREYVIKLFTLIPEQRSLDFLNKVRRFERNKDIKKAIQTLIDHLKEKLA